MICKTINNIKSTGTEYKGASAGTLFRRFVLVICILCLPLAAVAQSRAFDDLYRKYSNTRGVESRRIGRVMLVAARVTSSDLPKGLTGVRILSVQDRSAVATNVAATLDSDIGRTISSLPLRLINEDEGDGHTVKIYAQPAGGDKYKDVIIYMTGEKAIMVMELAGEFDNNEITKMTARNGQQR